jgi:hypothetical protein
MTDEEIIKLAEKTKKEKYCKRYLRDSTEKPYICDLDCPFNYDGMNCEDEYEIAFVDGFKAGFKKGEDSMSDYVMELQHAAYND